MDLSAREVLEREDEGMRVRMTVRLDPADDERLRRRLGEHDEVDPWDRQADPQDAPRA